MTTEAIGHGSFNESKLEFATCEPYNHAWTKGEAQRHGWIELWNSSEAGAVNTFCFYTSIHFFKRCMFRASD